jgi:hypothetical protein
MDKRSDEKAQGISQDMTLTAFDFLARVVPAWAAALRRFHAFGCQ